MIESRRQKKGGGGEKPTYKKVIKSNKPGITNIRGAKSRCIIREYVKNIKNERKFKGISYDRFFLGNRMQSM